VFLPRFVRLSVVPLPSLHTHTILGGGWSQMPQQCARASSFPRFLDHTQRRTKVSRSSSGRVISASQRSLPDNSPHWAMASAFPRFLNHTQRRTAVSRSSSGRVIIASQRSLPDNSPHWVMASSFTRFLYHTQRRITFGRTPLDE